MKDWRQEISNAVRDNCDHGGWESVIVTPGCPKCQHTCRRILGILDQALDTLADEIGHYASSSTPDAVRRFKRSIPDG